MSEWEWTPTIDGLPKRNGDLSALATAGGAIACIAIGVITADRFWYVMGFMLAGLFVFGLMSTRQLQSLRASISGPTLTISDTKATNTIDLRQVERIEINRRSAQVGGSRWVLEASGGGPTVTHQMASVAQYWKLPDEQIDQLRTGIGHYHDWYRGSAAGAATQSPVDEDPATKATAVMHASSIPPKPAPPGARVSNDPFEWRAPRAANADRNQRRWLIGTLLVAAAIAVIAAVQNWGDTTGVILSVLVVPGIVLLLGLGAWYSYEPGKRFRLTVKDGVIQSWNGDKAVASIALAGAQRIVVDVSHTRNHSTNTTHSNNYLAVERTGSSERISLPSGFGIKLLPEQRLELENQLRRLAGLG
ncbi:MAG: hypothetical protein AAF567_17235 [Actinomycetota bacterium]